MERPNPFGKDSSVWLDIALPLTFLAFCILAAAVFASGVLF